MECALGKSIFEVLLNGCVCVCLCVCVCVRVCDVCMCVRCGAGWWVYVRHKSKRMRTEICLALIFIDLIGHVTCIINHGLHNCDNC